MSTRPPRLTLMSIAPGCMKLSLQAQASRDQQGPGVHQVAGAMLALRCSAVQCTAAAGVVVPPAACSRTHPVKAAGSRTSAEVKAVPAAQALGWTRCASLSAICSQLGPKALSDGWPAGGAKARCCQSREQCSCQHCADLQRVPTCTDDLFFFFSRNRRECTGAIKHISAAGVCAQPPAQLLACLVRLAAVRRA